MRRPACSIMQRERDCFVKSCIAPQWPSRPPLELAPSGSQIERGRLSRTFAERTRAEPSPFAVRRPPSAVSRQPSLVLRDALAQCGRALPSAGRAGAGPARARATSACKQTAAPLVLLIHPRQNSFLWCTCVSASARQSRAQCCAREFCRKILFCCPVPSFVRGNK